MPHYAEVAAAATDPPMPAGPSVVPSETVELAQEAAALATAIVERLPQAQPPPVEATSIFALSGLAGFIR